MAEVIINVENLTLKREPWGTGRVEAEGIVSHPGFVVRCRDCKHATEPVDSAGLAIKEMEGWLDCLGKLTTGWDYYDDEPRYNLVEPDGFCKWGERK